MNTTVKLQTTDEELIKAMGKYVCNLKKQQNRPSEKMYNEAKSALVRTGVVTKRGKTKKRIVSWE